MSCDVPCKVGFCTWAWWKWIEPNTRKQMLLFLGDKAGLLAADSHSHTHTVCYCFPFVASCHSLCQSLIRTTGFRRRISHFSNFLTLHNERGGLKGIDWKEGESQRESKSESWVRAGGLFMNVLMCAVCCDVHVLHVCICLCGDSQCTQWTLFLFQGSFLIEFSTLVRFKLDLRLG